MHEWLQHHFYSCTRCLFTWCHVQCMIRITGTIVLYWLALSIDIFVYSPYCKSPNINKISFGFLLNSWSTWPRVKNVFLNMQQKQSRVSTGRAWTVFGLCRWWIDSQKPALQRLHKKHDIISKIWSYPCQMKHTSTPPPVTSPIRRGYNNTRLSLCAHFTSIELREQWLSRVNTTWDCWNRTDVLIGRACSLAAREKGGCFWLWSWHMCTVHSLTPHYTHKHPPPRVRGSFCVKWLSGTLPPVVFCRYDASITGSFHVLSLWTAG